MTRQMEHLLREFKKMETLNGLYVHIYVERMLIDAHGYLSLTHNQTCWRHIEQ